MSTSKNPSLTPVNRSRLYDEVVEYLREEILSGRIAPGTRLLQTDVAAQLGVSRTPLREAFRILERDGLIRMSNGNLTVEVASLADDEAIETYRIREVIDGMAAALAAERGLTEQMRSRLAADLDRMDAAVAPLALSRYSAAHVDFHTGVLEASGSRRVIELIPTFRISSQMVLSRRQSNDPVHGGRQAIDELLIMGNEDHRRIFDAILSGDPAAAEEAARGHAARTRHALERLARRAGPSI
jgi:GntR family transcriptional regulator, vanillate catabolism transcriptional regulator